MVKLMFNQGPSAEIQSTTGWETCMDSYYGVLDEWRVLGIMMIGVDARRVLGIMMTGVDGRRVLRIVIIGVDGRRVLGTELMVEVVSWRQAVRGKTPSTISSCTVVH